MRQMMTRATVWVVAVSLAGVAQAQDAALILGTERYEQLPRAFRAASVTAAQDDLAALGFAVSALPNGRSAATLAALADFAAAVPDADRLLVVLAGRFATDGRNTWFLTADSTPPQVFGVAPQGVLVQSVLDVLAAAPGQAVLMLGAEVGDDTVYDPYIRAGIGDLDIPQGVTVLRGEPRDVADFLTGELVRPQSDLIAAVTANRRIAASGYVPASLMFAPAASAGGPVIVNVTPPVVDTTAEDTLWEGAVALDTVDAYRNYIARFPGGRYTDQAETAISEIIAEPNRNARKAEDALALNRDARRSIQRSLSLLEFDTHGIDGIFGPDTRRAVTNWQQTNGYPQTGYLDAEQINRLDAQASRRAAEVEAEAERQQQAAARLDRAYWDETGAKGGEPGYRAYLERFPDGVFAELASTRLAEIEAQKRAAAQAEDRAAWDRAKAANTLTAYRAYLSAFPEGSFKAEAEAGIAALTSAETQAGADAAAAADESALGLNLITATLIEQRLQQLGLNPGPIDGQFDAATRRALRRYQTARDLPATGYVSQATVVRLLADAVTIRGR